MFLQGILGRPRGAQDTTLGTRSDAQREEMCLGIHREVDEWQGPAVAVPGGEMYRVGFRDPLLPWEFYVALIPFFVVVIISVCLSDRVIRA